MTRLFRYNKTSYFNEYEEYCRINGQFFTSFLWGKSALEVSGDYVELSELY